MCRFHSELRGRQPQFRSPSRKEKVYERIGNFLLMQQRVMDGGHPIIEVALSDIEDYYSKSETLGFASHISTNTRRYVKLFSDAADQVIEESRIRRLTPQTDQEDFEDALNSFRLNNYEKMDGPKPPKTITNILKRKL